MNEATIENGFAKVPQGAWLVGRAQPAACRGTGTGKGVSGLFSPDRAFVRVLESTGEMWCSAADRPFLVRLDAPPDATLSLISEKLLVAPTAARTGARTLGFVPFALRGSRAVTKLTSGWAVAATRSRVTRVALAEDEDVRVRPEALVAWIGADPSRYCPKLSVWDMFLPRMPRECAFTFTGPGVVWFEGGAEPARWMRKGGMR